MSAPSSDPSPVATILRRLGDPFEAERLETAPPAENPAHLAVLNRLFYDSSVDLGALVRIQGVTYLCTRSGWRRVPAGPGH